MVYASAKKLDFSNNSDSTSWITAWTHKSKHFSRFNQV